MLMSGLPLFPPQFNQIQLFFKIHAASAPFVTSGSSSNVEHKPSGPDGGMTYSRNWFSYEELIKATDGFSTLSLLGEGGFGFVYKGCLPDGREIAVKQLKIGGSQGEREFKAEVEIINRTPSSPLVPRIKCSTHTFPPITHRPHHLHFSLFSATSNIRLPSSPIVNNTSPHCVSFGFRNLLWNLCCRAFTANSSAVSTQQTASSLRAEQLPFTVPLSPQAAISVTLLSPFFT